MAWMDRIREFLTSQPAGSLNSERVFIVLAFDFVCLSWFALILAETRLFHWIPISMGIVGLAAGTLVFLRRYEGFERPSKVDLVFVLFAICFATWNALLSHDTFFGGRDPGVFANAAAYLSREGSLVVDRFINYPGWVLADGSFTVGFGIAHIAWLGSFHSLGGLTAIRFGNLIPILVALIAVYLVAKRFGGEYAGGFAIVGIATTYPFIWFARGTYNEIFFMALVWVGLLCLLVAWQERHPGYLLVGILSLGLSMHARLEGVLIFTAALLVLLVLHLRSRNQSILGLKHLALALAVIGHYLLYIQVVQPHYLQAHTSALTAIFKSLFVAPFSSGIPANPDAVRHHFPGFVFAALSAYHLAWPILFIPLAALIAFWKIRQEVSVQILAVIAILGPTLIYMQIPFVTLDQPWFLKRYVATIIPLGFLCASVVILKVLKRPSLVVPIVFLVVILNLNTASAILFHQEYDGMVEFVGDLSETFSKDDLVLVDRFATGNYKLADPLFFIFGRHTLWVSSSSEFLDHLRRQAPSLACNGNAFYVTSAESQLYHVTETVPSGSLELVWSRSVTFQELASTVDLLHYPGRPPDTYDMDYEVVKSLIEVPRDIRTRTFSVMVFRVDLATLELVSEEACASA